MLDIFYILHFYQHLNPWPVKITCNQPRGLSTLPCEAMAHSHKSASKAALEQFATLASLTEEHAHLAQSTNLFRSASELGALNVPVFFSAITEQHTANDAISALPPGPWTNEKATAAFAQLTSSITLLPILMRETAKMDIVLRSLHWETIWAYLSIYHWYDDSGPSLAEALFGIHREKGPEHLSAAHPRFAGLVNHIVRYMESVAKSDGTSAELRELPDDLYGLSSSASGKSTVKLAEVQSKKVYKGKDKRYTRTIQCFLNVISDQLIVPGMKGVASKLSVGNSTTTRRSETSENVRDNLILCGATLS